MTEQLVYEIGLYHPYLFGVVQALVVLLILFALLPVVSKKVLKAPIHEVLQDSRLLQVIFWGLALYHLFMLFLDIVAYSDHLQGYLLQRDQQSMIMRGKYEYISQDGHRHFFKIAGREYQGGHMLFPCFPGFAPDFPQSELKGQNVEAHFVKIDGYTCFTRIELLRD